MLDDLNVADADTAAWALSLLDTVDDDGDLLDDAEVDRLRLLAGGDLDRCTCSSLRSTTSAGSASGDAVCDYCMAEIADTAAPERRPYEQTWTEPATKTTGLSRAPMTSDLRRVTV